MVLKAQLHKENSFH